MTYDDLPDEVLLAILHCVEGHELFGFLQSSKKNLQLFYQRRFQVQYRQVNEYLSENDLLPQITGPLSDSRYVKQYLNDNSLPPTESYKDEHPRITKSMLRGNQPLDATLIKSIWRLIRFASIRFPSIDDKKDLMVFLASSEVQSILSLGFWQIASYVFLQQCLGLTIENEEERKKYFVDEKNLEVIKSFFSHSMLPALNRNVPGCMALIQYHSYMLNPLFIQSIEAFEENLRACGLPELAHRFHQQMQITALFNRNNQESTDALNAISDKVIAGLNFKRRPENEREFLKNVIRNVNLSDERLAKCVGKELLATSLWRIQWFADKYGNGTMRFAYFINPPLYHAVCKGIKLIKEDKTITTIDLDAMKILFESVIGMVFQRGEPMDDKDIKIRVRTGYRRGAEKTLTLQRSHTDVPRFLFTYVLVYLFLHNNSSVAVEKATTFLKTMGEIKESLAALQTFLAHNSRISNRYYHSYNQEQYGRCIHDIVEGLPLLYQVDQRFFNMYSQLKANHKMSLFAQSRYFFFLLRGWQEADQLEKARSLIDELDLFDPTENGYFKRIIERISNLHYRKRYTQNTFSAPDIMHPQSLLWTLPLQTVLACLDDPRDLSADFFAVLAAGSEFHERWQLLLAKMNSPTTLGDLPDNVLKIILNNVRYSEVMGALLSSKQNLARFSELVKMNLADSVYKHSEKFGRHIKLNAIALPKSFFENIDRLIDFLKIDFPTIHDKEDFILFLASPEVQRVESIEFWQIAAFLFLYYLGITKKTEKTKKDFFVYKSSLSMIKRLFCHSLLPFPNTHIPQYKVFFSYVGSLDPVFAQCINDFGKNLRACGLLNLAHRYQQQMQLTAFYNKNHTDYIRQLESEIRNEALADLALDFDQLPEDEREARRVLLNSVSFIRDAVQAQAVCKRLFLLSVSELNILSGICHNQIFGQQINTPLFLAFYAAKDYFDRQPPSGTLGGRPGILLSLLRDLFFERDNLPLEDNDIKISVRPDALVASVNTTFELLQLSRAQQFSPPIITNYILIYLSLNNNAESAKVKAKCFIKFLEETSFDLPLLNVHSRFASRCVGRAVHDIVEGLPLLYAIDPRFLTIFSLQSNILDMTNSFETRVRIFFKFLRGWQEANQLEKARSLIKEFNLFKLTKPNKFRTRSGYLGNEEADQPLLGLIIDNFAYFYQQAINNVMTAPIAAQLSPSALMHPQGLLWKLPLQTVLACLNQNQYGDTRKAIYFLCLLSADNQLTARWHFLLPRFATLYTMSPQSPFSLSWLQVLLLLPNKLFEQVCKLPDQDKLTDYLNIPGIRYCTFLMTENLGYNVNKIKAYAAFLADIPESALNELAETAFVRDLSLPQNTTRPKMRLVNINTEAHFRVRLLDVFFYVLQNEDWFLYHFSKRKLLDFILWYRKDADFIDFFCNEWEDEKMNPFVRKMDQYFRVRHAPRGTFSDEVVSQMFPAPTLLPYREFNFVMFSPAPKREAYEFRSKGAISSPSFRIFSE